MYTAQGRRLSSRMRRRWLCCLAAVAGVAGVSAEADDVDRTTYEMKLGFIPGTKPDVDTGFLTLDEAKLACEKKSACLAFTYRSAPETKERVHVYLKADSTVAESDKSWTSYVKRPAGLMDVTFANGLPFPLELCWIDMVGTAAPACYGTMACCGGTKNMSSFAGHNFVLKRLVWFHRQYALFLWLLKWLHRLKA